MKRLLILFAFFACLLSCTTDEIPPAEYDADKVDWNAALGYVFDNSVIPEIHISISREQWDALLAAFDGDKNTQAFVACDIEYRKGNEVTKIKEAGLRLKGNTSRRRPFSDGQYHHVHFGINLQKYHGDQNHSIEGVRRMDLKWFKDDAAYVREIFCYDLFHRRGVWTAVNNIYSRLWLKIGDEKELYYGVYELMEHIDKDYLRARVDQFGTKKGDLWKCSSGADLADVNASMGLDDNVTPFVYELNTGKEEDFPAAKARLQDFIQHLTELNGEDFDKWIAAHMDVDFLLKTYAVNVAVGMWDDYWNNHSNYYLYFAPGKDDNYKVWLLPYDYDNTLGTCFECGVQSDAGRQDPWKWGPDSAPLLTKILKNTEWRALYKQYLQQLCNVGGDFYYTNAMARIRAWQEIIAPFVSNDTKEDMTIEDKPAYWGNHHEYRIMDEGENNFFKIKAEAVNNM